MSFPSRTLPKLASLLRTSLESDALITLGQLLDSLPIGFFIVDCTPEHRVIYANHAWKQLISPGRLPVEDQPLRDVLDPVDSAGALEILHGVCSTGTPRHIRSLPFTGLRTDPAAPAGHVTTWDWELYPLTDTGGATTHVLSVVLDVTELANGGRSGRRRSTDPRDDASGVLQLFGVAPRDREPLDLDQLTVRESEVAELVATSAGNTAIAQQLGISTATVSSHVAHILAKLGFRSRTQIATWIVEQRLEQSRREA
jgi:DNA-binding CsgD family transcriptional regulator